MQDLPMTRRLLLRASQETGWEAADDICTFFLKSGRVIWYK
jgi:hypothetical protein